jgi:hypothetical protein
MLIFWVNQGKKTTHNSDTLVFLNEELLRKIDV